MNYKWRMPSQDPEALADRSHRSLICELCDSLACLMFVTPSNKIRCPIDNRIIWSCYKILLKHLKDSDVLPHVKIFLYYMYYRVFIVRTLNGISIFS